MPQGSYGLGSDLIESSNGSGHRQLEFAVGENAVKGNHDGSCGEMSFIPLAEINSGSTCSVVDSVTFRILAKHQS